MGGTISRRASAASKSNVAARQSHVLAQHVAEPGRPADSSATHRQLHATKAADTRTAQRSITLNSLESTLSIKVAAAAEHLAAHGWAVVPGVLSKEECQQYEQGVWDWLARLGNNIRQDDPSSWADANGWPPSYKGIVNTLEVAHQDFVWRVRKHPRLLQVFAELYGTNELLTSFDSINLMAPGTDASGGWLHVDHAPLKKGCQCIQGLVNMVDVGPDTTGTLMVKDKSHLLLEDFYAQHTLLTAEQKAETGDWYVFQKAELPHWESLASLGLSGSAGDLFLWDSRTAHQNIGPAATTAWRHVVYACYQPRSLATERDLQLKQQAWDNFLITRHWPSHNVTVFPGLGNSESYYVASTDAASDKADEQQLGTEQSRDGAADGGASDGAAVSSIVVHQQGTAEQQNGHSADDPAVDAAAAGIASTVLGTAAASEAAEANAEQQQQQQQEKKELGYWEARAAEGDVKALLVPLRTRHRVEDAVVRKLAGMEAYEASEVWRKEALVDVYGAQLPAARQPEAA